MNELVMAAIESLRPGEGFVLRGDDYEGIEWQNAGVEPVTTAEVEAAMQAVVEQRSAARAATLAKLEALGLNADDLAALTQ